MNTNRTNYTKQASAEFATRVVEPPWPGLLWSYSCSFVAQALWCSSPQSRPIFCHTTDTLRLAQRRRRSLKLRKRARTLGFGDSTPAVVLHRAGEDVSGSQLGRDSLRRELRCRGACARRASRQSAAPRHLDRLLDDHVRNYDHIRQDSPDRRKDVPVGPSGRR